MVKVMPRARMRLAVVGVSVAAAALWGCPSLDGIRDGLSSMEEVQDSASPMPSGGGQVPLLGDASAPSPVVVDAGLGNETDADGDPPIGTDASDAGAKDSLSEPCADPESGCGDSRIPCGGKACIAHDAICCRGANQVCLPAAAIDTQCGSPTEAASQCDDATDCPSGQVCCIDLSFRLPPAPPIVTRCATSCPLSPQACHTSLECGADPCVHHTCTLGFAALNLQVCDRLLTMLCGP
jgi:hypothetical protein